MKPAAIRYITLLGIFLLGSAAIWSSLLEARGTSIPTSRIMQSAQLFEQQGRLGKAAELYRRVLAANPRNVQARLSLERMTRNAHAVLGPILRTTPKPAAEVTLVQAVKPAAKTPELISAASGSDSQAAKQPELSFQKTRNALVQAGEKFNGLIPGFAVSQPKQNANDGDSKAPSETVVASSAAKAEKAEKARLAAEAVQAEKARLAAEAVQAEKARLAAKATRDEKARLKTKAVQIEVAADSISGSKTSETRKILGRVGGNLQKIVPEPAPKRPDFEEMGVVPPKPQIPEYLKRNGLAETSPALNRPLQKLDENGQPIVAAKPVADSDEAEPLQPVSGNAVLPKTQSALTKAKERVDGLFPLIPGRLETGVPESDGTRTRGLGSQFVAKSREAWAKFRKGVTSRKTETSQAERSPLWRRLNDALARTKTNVSEKNRSNSDQVFVDEITEAREIDPSAGTGVTERLRDGQILPLTVLEQIAAAQTQLELDASDPAGRAALIQLVDSAPDFEASLAAYTLGTRAKGHADIMAALGQQLMLRGGVAKVHMAEAMLRLDGNHVTATDALLKLTASEDKRVRMIAAFSMQSATNGQRERCITELIKVLKDSDSDVRASAVLALGAYGPSAKRAIPAIVTVIHDVDPGTARAAGVALQCVVRNSLDSKTIRPVAAETVGGK